jgi:LysM repeat protein
METAPVAENAVPSAEAAAMSEPAAQESIVVDASEELPMGGPVAANPPANPADGSYSPAYGETSYFVRPGDTLFSIAQRYGTSVDAIAYANGLTSDVIGVGQQLNIPAGSAAPYPGSGYMQPPQNAPQQPAYGNQQPYQQPGTYQQPYAPAPGSGVHMVSPGDTLYGIALQYGSSVEEIALANTIAYPYDIQIGQQLVIPPPSNYGAPAPGYGQQQPVNPYYQQQPVPGNDYYQQQPDGYYQQQPVPGNDYYQQQPDGYYQQPGNNTFGQPGGAGTHTVSPGETLFSIAMRYGTSAETLAAANGLYNPNEIFVGQVLYLP